MEDNEETLLEYGIKHGVWSEDAPAPRKNPCLLPAPVTEDMPRCNPRSDDFDPYVMVSCLIRNASVKDFQHALMSLSNSLNEALLQKERLVRTHFNTYVKCRSSVERMAVIKQEVDRTHASLQSPQIRILSSALSPIIAQHRGLEKKKNQAAFLMQNRALFDGPSALAEHLHMLDYPAFVQEFQEAKKTAAKYPNSRFVEYLWSRFVKVLAEFKLEISKRIELSASLAECLKYFQIYNEVDPSTTDKMLGTLLLVAKKEVHGLVEAVIPVQKKNQVHKRFLVLVEQVLEVFVFMARTMNVVEAVTPDQQSVKRDFLESANAAVVDALEKSMSKIFGSFPEKDPGDAVLALDTVKDVLREFEIAEKKLGANSVPSSSGASHRLHKHFIALIWSSAHKMRQKDLLGLLEECVRIFGKDKNLLKQVKKTLSLIADENSADSGSADASSRRTDPSLALTETLLMLNTTIPKCIQILGEYFDALKTKLGASRDALQEAMAARLRENIQAAESEEEVAMAVLRAKSRLHIHGTDTAGVTMAVIRLATANSNLSPFLSHYLARFTTPQESPQEPNDSQKKKIEQFRLQLEPLLD